jgi:ribosomal protein S18 acetylase RimI-like enzyme
VPACGRLSLAAFRTTLEGRLAPVKMAISASISRLAAYYTRHGFRATVRRVGLAARRTLFSSREILFYCDLPAQSLLSANLPSSLEVERHKNQSALSPQNLQEIISFWNPKLARRNINERFELGASLWLIKVEDNLAGYGWTLQGRTVAPHYFRLGPDDIHLFDFHVFPQYRGRGMNPSLVSYILRSLAAESHGRAFIEAAEWNQAQLASLRKTPFRPLGWARKFTILRRTIVYWDRNQAAEYKRELKKQSIPPAARKGSSIPDLRA